MKETITNVFKTKEAYLSNFVDKRDGNNIYAKWKRDEEIGIVVFAGINDVPIGTIFLTEAFYFLYCLDGEISFYCKNDGNLINLKRGELIIVNPNCPIIIGHENPAFLVALMMVTNEYFLKEYFSIIDNNKRLFHFFLDSFNGKNEIDYLYFNNLPIELVDMTFIAINKEYHSEELDNNIMIRALLQLLIVHLSRSTLDDARQSLVDDILKYILFNPKTSLKDLAYHFKYHPNYISKYIKDNTGHTFKQILTQTRMDKAYNYLVNSNFSVEEIALMVGYSDTITFYKAFKKYYNQSPTSVKTKTEKNTKII